MQTPNVVPRLESATLSAEVVKLWAVETAAADATASSGGKGAKAGPSLVRIFRQLMSTQILYGVLSGAFQVSVACGPTAVIPVEHSNMVL